MEKENIDIYEVYDNWRKGLNKFKWQLISTPFASSKNVVNEISFEEADKLREISLEEIFDEKIINLFKSQKEYELLVLDLEEDMGLDVAVELNLRFKVKIIPVFAHIFHQRGRIGSEAMLKKLIQYSYKIQNNIEQEKYCLLLDYNRFSDEDYDRTKYFNNEYRLTEEELPESEVIKAYGVNKIKIISKNSIKKDIEEYIQYLSDCEIEIEVFYLDNEK